MSRKRKVIQLRFRDKVVKKWKGEKIEHTNASEGVQ